MKPAKRHSAVSQSCIREPMLDRARLHWPCRLVMVLILLLLSVGLRAYGAEEPLPEGAGRPAFYPQEFDGMGRIDRLEGREIVIDDSLYRLGPGSNFATPRGNHASRAGFRVGSYVGFVLNATGEIRSLWLIRH